MYILRRNRTRLERRAGNEEKLKETTGVLVTGK
jgi:hypothetical protein